ncbi:MAG: hypothetical protein AB7F89_08090, partial [Pirellulaceae bacterium]
GSTAGSEAEPLRRRAHLVTVPVPIAGTVDTQVKRQLERLAASEVRGEDRPVLVLEFRSESGTTGEGSEFERCLSLARYLAGERMSGIRTVAFLPDSVTGHAVLPILACEEIVMAEEASLGAAGQGEAFIDDTIRGSYREIAERRRTIPVAVVLGMLDPALNVYKVQIADGARYVLDAELEQLQKETAARSVETLSRAGDLARFSGKDLRVRFGFVSHLAGDREQLTAALGLPRGALDQDPSAGGAWHALQVDLRGPINAKQISWIERSLRDRLAQGDINLVCLAIDSGGGSLVDSLRLANYLASLDRAVVRTVAYVESQARADAALVALACDQLVCGEEARLGGPGEIFLSERDLEALRASASALAESTGGDWSLMVSLLDPDLVVHRYTHPDGGAARLLSEEEWRSLGNPDEWIRGEVLDTSDGLSGAELLSLDVADSLAGSVAELRRLLHLEGDIERLEPTWAHLFIEQLASPRVAGILLFLAWFTLMIEISQPGLGVPGFLSAVCFVLYFWSNFLHGTSGWLEVLLFVAGIASVLVELFLVPGTGIFGVGGGLLIISSIVLASQTFVVPRNSYQLGQMPASLFMVAAAGAGAFGAMVLVRQYIAEAPVLNRMILPPPDEDEMEARDEREALIHLAHLIGKRGRALTPLMPSGKAQFGDEIVSVASSGEPIARDAAVVAIADRGNYLLIESVDEG